MSEAEPTDTSSENKQTNTPEPSFETPEQVAAHDTSEPVTPKAKAPVTEPQKTGWKQWFSWSWPPNKQQIIFASVVLAMLVFAVAGLLVLRHGSKTPVATTVVHHAAKKIVPPTPTTVPSTLSGLPVDPSVNARTVTGVMIENSTDARPQSGLSQASVVFEAIAEGGITRFLALYQDQLPDNVGPIRSARPYYLQWLQGFDAPIAHVGGSPEALADIKSWNIKDLDQFYNGGSYHRITSRAAPHNVYTSLATLNQLEQSKGFTTSNFTGFARKADAPAKAPTTTSIDLAISSYYYNVHYDYNAATNSYNRSEGGAAHIDANTNAQISPKVVIAMVIPYNLEADDKHSQYGIVGNGQAYIFQDGGVTVGSWSKTAPTAQITFSDSSGKPVKLNAGQTWLSAVATSSKVTYK